MVQILHLVPIFLFGFTQTYAIISPCLWSFGGHQKAVNHHVILARSRIFQWNLIISPKGINYPLRKHSSIHCKLIYFLTAVFLLLFSECRPCKYSVLLKSLCKSNFGKSTSVIVVFACRHRKVKHPQSLSQELAKKQNIVPIIQYDDHLFWSCDLNNLELYALLFGLFCLTIDGKPLPWYEDSQTRT